jgi:carboxylate-amine ligase
MTLPAFRSSEPLTLGVELELQVVDMATMDLSPQGLDLLHGINMKGCPGEAKPEITQSMIEVSTGVCRNHAEVIHQLDDLHRRIVQSARRLDVGVCGGGTHAFQHWAHQKIVDTARFRQLSSLYGYLSKQFTIFGQHVHVGCPDADTALYTLHCMSRFIPHLIALAASSPFVQGSDTGFQSARLNSVFAFPLSGRAPMCLSWAEFEKYFAKMQRTGVVEGMKDFYWDIRPKPEFGTIEVRVLDTPLTRLHAADLAALVQCLARWIQQDRPFQPSEDDYLVYTFNRFQACRFGLHGAYVDPKDGSHEPLGDSLQRLLEVLAPHADALMSMDALRRLSTRIGTLDSDADWLRARYSEERSVARCVAHQVDRWLA